MFEFTVNGQLVSVERDGKLLTYLREDLGLTSAKNGCSEGACGTCMVLVDGKATRCCVLKISRCVGKSIVTCEGLSEKERAVYGHAFAHCGAVQCGFCTPGMIMSAKGLLDANESPTPEQVREALKFNICRCTGYKKIEEAVLLAAAIFRSEVALPEDEADGTGRAGQSIVRVDAFAKALGNAQYVDDLKLPGMLRGGAVRSRYPRARVLSIDVTEARNAPGVVAIVTAADLKGKIKVGHIKQDQYVLVPVGEETHFLGDPIVLVAAETEEELEAAKKLVSIEYEELTPVTSPVEAMASGAPVIDGDHNLLSHEHLVRGDAEGALKASAHVVTTQFHTPPTEHAFLEPEAAVALPDGDGVLIYSSDQGIYQTKHECAWATGLPEEKVRVIAKMVGGGFGGKEDMSVQHHAAILALTTERPVKVTMTRAESILCHPKRHGFDMEFTLGCTEEGFITALKATLLSDTGAFASLGGPVLQRACTHAAGPYNYQNIDISGKAYYTNNPPCGAFRGFGVTQSNVALECSLNLLAEKVGISPWEIRYRNAIRTGQVLPNGQIADETTSLVETLEAIKPYFDANPKAGLACAMKNSGIGVGLPDIGRCRLVVEGEKVHFYSSAACIGQGMGTVALQIVCETTGLKPHQVCYHDPDTSSCPDSGNTTASRQTLFTGEATRQASLELKEALNGTSLAALEGREFYAEYRGLTDKMGADKPNPVSHIAYGYATHLVELNEEGRVARVVAAHDVGQAINPVNVEGQIEGGVVMALGYALTEDYPLQNGIPKAKYGTLGLFRATQIPELHALIVKGTHSELACGAKGIGEIASIPTAAAVQLAYYNYDGQFRNSLPLENTPYRPRK